MAIYKLEKTQLVKTDKETLWNFISSPKNLQEITPAEMGFQILTENLADEMYAGQMINYKVSPMLGIKLNWCTEITHVDKGNYFVDEQRFGPYAMWHHEHHLKETPEGMLMTDIIHYKLPLGILGDFAKVLFVKKKLDGIFEHRFKVMEEKFNQ
jgi:ligand-binding SRPBCC domain-containing protein